MSVRWKRRVGRLRRWFVRARWLAAANRVQLRKFRQQAVRRRFEAVASSRRASSSITTRRKTSVVVYTSRRRRTSSTARTRARFRSLFRNNRRARRRPLCYGRAHARQRFSSNALTGAVNVPAYANLNDYYACTDMSSTGVRFSPMARRLTQSRAFDPFTPERLRVHSFVVGG